MLINICLINEDPEEQNTIITQQCGDCQGSEVGGGGGGYGVVNGDGRKLDLGW